MGTPLGPRSLLTKVVRVVDVIVESRSMPIDMLVLLMSDFDVVLGMD